MARVVSKSEQKTNARKVQKVQKNLNVNVFPPEPGGIIKAFWEVFYKLTPSQNRKHKEERITAMVKERDGGVRVEVKTEEVTA